MKKLILLIGIFLCVNVLYSANPLIKFYLKDATFKSYDIDNINVMSLVKIQNNSTMKIYYQKSQSVSYASKDIDSIRFEKTDNLIVYINGVQPTKYELAEIDSILFLPSSANESVVIGGQVWMLKNLDVSEYRNGDPIPECTDSATWMTLKTGAWCYYNNDPANNTVYGKLYNWYAINDPRGIAPVGWRVGNDSDWTVLTDFVKGEINGGGKLKEAGTSHWSAPNTSATNESGFTALPGGYRIGNGFGRIKDAAAFWMATEVDNDNAWSRYLFSFKASISKNPNYKGTGFSVRCIKDE